jgi:hypothetical protein
MATDEYVRRISYEDLFDTSWIPSWVTRDMSHPDLHSFTLESGILGNLLSNGLVIDVSVNGTNGFEISQLLQYLQRAKIARVPYLVTVLESGQYPSIQKSVRV